ncbi:hypothetical protein [Streptomyces himalayensis]|uniref:Uncharacterized protein n=1 Tax=Streptomyces himalayensis subsp. himalayensis TaxID=2756131 RepID=A0A7W0I7T3_9ACTN|nr:hypothetical protein [Streptomyces himalayensis]MBA2945650.1 hypothetical protein [Streptomyces himalayensis subsp. himalayensis]
MPGVDGVLDTGGKARHGLDYERAGNLVLVAERGAWFTYLLCSDRLPTATRSRRLRPEP